MPTPRTSSLSYSPRRLRGMRGFSLPEILATGVIGALLLTALAYATTEFAVGVGHMEKKAGIDDGEDMVLRLLTRDIREAWWAEVPDTHTIELADPEGNITRYYLEDGSLKVLKPNGDMGDLLSDLTTFDVEALTVDRYREGEPSTYTGDWYTRAMPAGLSFALEVPEHGKLSLGFQAPVKDSELPGGGVPTPEELILIHAQQISLKLAWIQDDSDDDLLVQLFESSGPGSGLPQGDAIGSISIDGSALPDAVAVGGSWAEPTATVTLNISGIAPYIEEGVGYAVVLNPEGSSRIVLSAKAEMPSVDRDDIMLKDNWGEDYVSLPLAVPFTLSGQYMLTGTIVTPVVSTISMTLIPESGQIQTRSATLLGQSVSDDPWAGVVPGELAP